MDLILIELLAVLQHALTKEISRENLCYLSKQYDTFFNTKYAPRFKIDSYQYVHI
jgi:hypothetical protein